MKKLLALFVLISSITNAQFTINGTMTPTIKTDWAILYKIEGARQNYIANTKIIIDTLTIEGKQKAIGNFSFSLPADAKIGAYRVKYRTNNAGFVDFIYNKEDVAFVFNPDYPDQSVAFSKSKENILYKSYIDAITLAQKNLDSIQVAVLQNPNLQLSKEYNNTYKKVNATQKKFEELSKNKYVHPFIVASSRYNNPTIINSVPEYLQKLSAYFFKNIDFKNKTLLNSSFLVDRIADYIFYINYSDNPATQQKLYKKSVDTVLAKLDNERFKKDVIEFLAEQFEATQNTELTVYLIKNYYKKLPKNIQDKKFLEDKKPLFATVIGSIAPDFSWKENNRNYSLSSLKEAENYVLVFWSTDCSHCLKEIPELHKSLKTKSNVKVIAFAMERNDFGWKNMKKTLSNWHHVLGLNKWENKIARQYNILSTPTYFVLDKNKKIIAKPNAISDVKKFFE